MSTNLYIEKYEEQLPKPKDRSFWVWFGRFSAFISVIGVGLGFYYFDKTVPELFFAIYLCVLVTFFITFATLHILFL